MNVGDPVFVLMPKRSFRNGKYADWIQKIPGLIHKLDDCKPDRIWVSYETDMPHHFSTEAKNEFRMAECFPRSAVIEREWMPEEIE